MDVAALARISVLVLIALVVVGCADSTVELSSGSPRESAVDNPEVTSTILGTSTTAQDFEEADFVAVIAAAVTYRVNLDNTMGEADPFDKLFIADHFWEPSAAFDVDRKFGAQVPQEVRSAIEASLDQIEIAWVADSDSAVDWDMSSGDAPRAAVLVMTAPTFSDGRAEVTTELTCGNLCAISSTYVLQHGGDGSWSVEGTVGPESIS